MSFFFSWFRKQKQKRCTSTDSTFDGGPEMDVSTEDLYSGSYFSVENELSYITNSGHNFANLSSKSSNQNKSAKHQSINRGNHKTIDLSRRKEEKNSNNNSTEFDDHSGDLWKVLMES